MKTRPRVLLLCYGNPARLDDGLGPAFARAIEACGIPDVTVETNYQLMLEDAVAISRHDLVIFVDACTEGEAPFSLVPVLPQDSVSFTTHEVKPGFLVKLAEELFPPGAPGYALGIRGYRFDNFGEELSPAAQANLEAAAEFVRELLTDNVFDRLEGYGCAAPRLG